MARRLLEQNALSRQLSELAHPSSALSEALRTANLQDDALRAAGPFLENHSLLSQLARDAAEKISITDKFHARILANQSGSILDQVAGLRASHTLAPLGQPVAVGTLAEANLAFSEVNVIGQAMRSSSEFLDRFKIPEIAEIAVLTRSMQSTLDAYGLARSTLVSRYETLRKPWLDMQDSVASLTALTRLQGIGHIVADAHSFEPKVASLLRTDLGDWRDRIIWPSDLGIDIGVRAELYLERGFNASLTEFPEETFDESLDASGLHDDVPPLVAFYGEAVPPSDDADEEEGFARNTRVHDLIQRFETQIRRFIDAKMTAAFGNDWARLKLPNGMYDKWLDKQSKDVSGRTWPLVYYADFTDYELILCNDGLWKAVFVGNFKRKELVRESMQRLMMPRVATAHSRLLMLEDELFAFAEVKRLMRQILN